VRAIALVIVAVVPAVLLNAGCGPAVDLTRALRVESVTTGWYETNAAEGHVKLVPTVRVKLKNVSGQTLRTLQVNAIFKRVTDDTEWSSGFRTLAGSSGLSPASSTEDVFIVSPLGYTGTESRFDLLKNSHFIDARVDIFAKAGAMSWARIGEYAIARQLIEP
jgi:hypothetical protein